MTRRSARLPRRLSASALIAAAFLAALVALAAPIAVAAPPSGFITQTIGGSWNEVAGITFIEDGRAIAWERGGRLWMIEADGTRHASPMLDISQEVGAWRDHGLLGVALHPNFLNNGRIFLLYVVDRHHLLNFGTPQYNANTNEYFAASIGRITRYTATAASNFTQVDPTTRLVLLGESFSTGIPVVHQSHGVGSLLFGDDGTLLVSVGDNASYEGVDLGGQVSGGYVTQALASGILTAKENIGAFRAQLIDCLCGKILRLDPDTGDGIPSNLFFDATAPRAPRSRVWCLGVRNPFRMEMIPGTGDHLPSAGNPGTLVIGDVGWYSREEVSVADGPALNFGWPVFEGLDWMIPYATASIANADAPNPLLGASNGPACTTPSFFFKDLLRHDTTDPMPLFVNPCGLYQAESATFSGPVLVTDVPGFTGTGYLDYQNANNDYIEWKVTIPVTGSYTARFRYALGPAGNRSLRITVDAVQVDPSLDFFSTGSWSETKWATLDLPLSAGLRRIRATAIGSSGPNIDALSVMAVGESVTSIPTTIPTFVHRRPRLDWSHGSAQALVPGFAGDVPIGFQIGTPQSGVIGQPFQGYCAVGGSRVETGAWPSAWHGVTLFGDFSSQFIRGLRFDASGQVIEVKVFDSMAGPVVLNRYNAVDDSLWVARWGNQLVRITYAPSANQPPVIVATATPNYGAAPLLVTLDASKSFDPEGTALTFTWSFPDGSRPANGAVVQQTFTSSEPARHDVTLTVRDLAGIESSQIVPVWTNNTPPVVDITSVSDGDLYSMRAKSIVPLEATISDAEHRNLICAWTTILHHNEHEHAEPVDAQCATSAPITPVGCSGEVFFYEIRLTVTDPLALSTTDVVFLYPDCEGTLVCSADINDDGVVDGAEIALVLGSWNTTGVALPADLNDDGVVDGADIAIVLGAWGPCP